MTGPDAQDGAPPAAVLHRPGTRSHRRVGPGPGGRHGACDGDRDDAVREALRAARVEPGAVHRNLGSPTLPFETPETSETSMTFETSETPETPENSEPGPGPGPYENQERR